MRKRNNDSTGKCAKPFNKFSEYVSRRGGGDFIKSKERNDFGERQFHMLEVSSSLNRSLEVRISVASALE